MFHGILNADYNARKNTNEVTTVT